MAGLLTMFNPGVASNPFYQAFDQRRDLLSNTLLGGVGAETPLQRMRGMAQGALAGRETTRLLESERQKQAQAQQQVNSTLQAMQKAGRDDLVQAVQGGLPIAEAWNQFLSKGNLEPTAEMRNLEWRAQHAGLQPGSPEYADFMRSGGRKDGVTVNVGNGAPGIGKLSADYGYILDPKTGQPVIDPATGLPRAAPVPGSPAAQEGAGRQRAQTTAMQSYEQKFNMVDKAINDVLESTSNWTAGPGGAVLSNIPGTDAYDMARTIDTIKANLGFEELQAMRDSSPTGGALGQVTERELAFLQAAQGNLDQAQTPEQLKEVLRDIQARRREFREARRRAYEIDFGVPAPETGGADMSLDQLLDMYGD